MAKKNKGVVSLSGDTFEKYMVGDSVMYRASENTVMDEYAVVEINHKERLLGMQRTYEKLIWVRFENTQLLPF